MTPHDVARLVSSLVETLAASNLILRREGLIPSLYEAGLVYYYDWDARLGPQPWRDGAAILQEGNGAACAELSAWRIADLRLQGEPATPGVTYTVRKDGVLFHAFVKRPNGNEDPSLILGMEPNP